MADRTSETTVTFRHPFRLSAIDRPQPAGTYTVVTDEEEIAGLSYAAFRRTATMLRLPALSAAQARSEVARSEVARSEVICIDPLELTAALIADRRQFI